MQDEALSLMFQAWNLILPNIGYLKQCVFFPFKLNFIATGYRRNQRMFKDYHFIKYFIMLGAVGCVYVSILGGERSIGIILIFPFELLESKGKW